MTMRPAELGRLSNFFDCLAARDFHNPVLRENLTDHSKHCPTSVPELRITPVSLPDAQEADSAPVATEQMDPLDAAKLVADALNLRPPHAFTFTRMLHDVYGPQKFAEMVEEVLRASRATFQPLPAELKGRRARTMSDAFEAQGRGITPARALKKRCVGRKITPIGGVSGGNGWLYDVAVASADDEAFEPMRRRRAVSNASLESPSSPTFSDTFSLDDADEEATLVDPRGPAGLVKSPGSSPTEEEFSEEYGFMLACDAVKDYRRSEESFGVKRRYSDSCKDF